MKSMAWESLLKTDFRDAFEPKTGQTVQLKPWRRDNYSPPSRTRNGTKSNKNYIFIKNNILIMRDLQDKNFKNTVPPSPQ